MRLIYRAILAPAPELVLVLVPVHAPAPTPVTEIVPPKVLLVSDEELSLKITELKAKYPENTSIKSLCKHLKREKTEWQVTETRLVKLLKKPATMCENMQ